MAKFIMTKYLRISNHVNNDSMFYNVRMDFTIGLTLIFCLVDVESLALFKLSSLGMLRRILQGNVHHLGVS